MLPPVLADINVAVQVVAFLRERGVDVASALERGWALRSDAELLSEGLRSRRLLLTHDADFGRLAIAEGHPVHGILRLRPGDDPPDVVIRGITPLLQREIDWSPPLVAVFRDGRLRIRRLPRPPSRR